MFDPAAAKRLSPGGHIVVDAFPGLRLEAGKRARTWTYRYKDTAGKMRQAKLGDWPRMGLEQAVKAWQEARDLRADGIDPRAARKRAKAAQGPLTVAGLVDAFLTRYIDAERSAGSAASARSALERLLADEPDLAAALPSDVHRADAYRIIEDRRNFPTAAAKLRALLGQCWDYGRDAGLIDSDTPNWWREVMRGRLRSKGKIIGGEHQGKVYRTLTDDELAQLLPWSLANMHRNGRDALVLFLWTGLRGVEICGLRPEFIGEERDGWWITYPAALLKQERDADVVDHRVPLVGRALDVVRARLERVGPTGYLFETAKGGEVMQWGRSALSSYFYHLNPGSAKQKRRAGEGLVAPVARWSGHDLRRTARTMLTRLRVDARVAEAFIGHKPTGGIEAVYDRHTFDQEKREAAPLLAEAMERHATTGGSSPSS